MATKIEAVGIRLDAKLKAQLQQRADAEYRSLSNLVAKILVEWCHDQQGHKSKPINGHAAKSVSP